MPLTLGPRNAARSLVVPVLIGVAAVAAAAAASAAPAAAAPSSEVIEGEFLRIESSADWDAAAHLLPGDVVEWDLAISAETPDPSTVDLGVSATGGAPLALDAALCDTAWLADACPGVATPLRSGWEVPRDGVTVPLTSVPSSETAHLRLTVSLASSEGGRTEVTVRAQTEQESISAVARDHRGSASGDPLATTGGGAAAVWWTVGTLAIVGGGILASGHPRARRQENEEVA